MQELKLTDLDYFENLAFFLKSQHGSTETEVAFVRHQHRVYFSQSGRRQGPSSAVVKLIQGIFDIHRDLSFFILRNRIWTTEHLGPMARGMVRLAAKRVSEIHARDHGLDYGENVSEVGKLMDFIYPARALLEPYRRIEVPTRIHDVEEGVRWSVRLAQSVPRGSVLHDHNRAIGAILCSEDGEVLDAATNAAGLNKTLHAEVRAVQGFFQRTGRLIPEGARIYVSLKPCQMCAGMIAESCEDLASLKIYFAENDGGPCARSTAVEKNLNFYDLKSCSSAGSSGEAQDEFLRLNIEEIHRQTWNHPEV